jgi:hypothetical protein
VTVDIAGEIPTTAIAEGMTLGKIASEFMARATGEDSPAALIEA